MEGSAERRTIAMGKLTIQEVAKILVEKNGLTQRDASRFASEFFAVILQHLQEDEPVKIKGLGTFKIINVEARESISVRTGERVVIDSHSKVTFIPDNTMKELVNKPFSQFETVVLNDGVDFPDIDTPQEPEEEVVETETVAPEPAAPVIGDEVPVIEPEPAPVVEPEPAPVVEPEPAPVVEPEPAPVVEPETPVVEEEAPVVEPEPAPVVEEPVAPVVEEAVAPVVEEPALAVEPEAPVVKEEPIIKEEEDEERSQKWCRWLAAVLGVLILMGLSCFAGYEFGKHQQVSNVVVVHDTLYVPDPDSTDIDLPVETEDVQPVEEVKPQPVVKKQPASVVKPAPAPVAKPEAAPVAKPESTEVKAEPAPVAKPKPRLGGYRIVGTAEEVVVQEGQTFFSICRVHIGSDKQHYVEQYNGLPRDPQIKVGQVIKIPKLERIE